MRWGEFKRQVEEQGATDETELDYVDVSFDTQRVKLLQTVGGDYHVTDDFLYEEGGDAGPEQA